MVRVRWREGRLVGHYGSRHDGLTSQLAWTSAIGGDGSARACQGCRW